MKKFLTAKWHNLVMANYVVEPSLLENRVPRGTSLDFHEEKLFVSLVGFMFLDTRVLGIPIPFHINFEEVNLRFYVKRETEGEVRRGVCFVKEIVPRLAITTVARTIYGEPYETWQMSHEEKEKELTYNWEKDGVKNRLHVEIAENLGVPSEGSEGEFIIEHYWGYTKRGTNRTNEYKVEHPKWELYKVNYAEIEVDFGQTYGPEFAFLNEQEPASILLAKGSEIAVYLGEHIKADTEKPGQGDVEKSSAAVGSNSSIIEEEDQKVEDPVSKTEDQIPKVEDLVSKTEEQDLKTESQISKTKVRKSKTKEPDSKTKVQSSKVKTQKSKTKNKESK